MAVWVNAKPPVWASSDGMRRLLFRADDKGGGRIDLIGANHISKYERRDALKAWTPKCDRSSRREPHPTRITGSRPCPMPIPRFCLPSRPSPRPTSARCWNAFRLNIVPTLTRLRHLSRLDVAYDPFPNQVSVPHRQPDQLGLSTGTDAVLLRTGDRHRATERRGRWSIATSWGLNTELTRIYALMIAIRDADPCLRSHQQARVVYADRVAAARIS